MRQQIGVHGTTAQACSEWLVYMAPLHNQAQTSSCTWHHRTSILRQMVYMTPVHKQAQTSWCTWHHRTSILTQTVYVTPPHKHTQTDGVHGTTTQAYSDGVHGTTAQAYSDRRCTWHQRTNRPHQNLSILK